MIDMCIDEFYCQKRQVLLDNDGDDRKLSAIIEPRRINGDYIRLGGYFSDEVKGWYNKREIHASVVTIVKTFYYVPE